MNKLPSPKTDIQPNVHNVRYGKLPKAKENKILDPTKAKVAPIKVDVNQPVLSFDLPTVVRKTDKSPSRAVTSKRAVSSPKSTLKKRAESSPRSVVFNNYELSPKSIQHKGKTEPSSRTEVHKNRQISPKTKVLTPSPLMNKCKKSTLKSTLAKRGKSSPESITPKTRLSSPKSRADQGFVDRHLSPNIVIQKSRMPAPTSTENKSGQSTLSKSGTPYPIPVIHRCKDVLQPAVYKSRKSFLSPKARKSKPSSPTLAENKCREPSSKLVENESYDPIPNFQETINSTLSPSSVRNKNEVLSSSLINKSRKSSSAIGNQNRFPSHIPVPHKIKDFALNSKAHSRKPSPKARVNKPKDLSPSFNTAHKSKKISSRSFVFKNRQSFSRLTAYRNRDPFSKPIIHKSRDTFRRSSFYKNRQLSPKRNRIAEPFPMFLTWVPPSPKVHCTAKSMPNNSPKSVHRSRTPEMLTPVQKSSRSSPVRPIRPFIPHQPEELSLKAALDVVKETTLKAVVNTTMESPLKPVSPKFSKQLKTVEAPPVLIESKIKQPSLIPLPTNRSEFLPRFVTWIQSSRHNKIPQTAESLPRPVEHTIVKPPPDSIGHNTEHLAANTISTYTKQPLPIPSIQTIEELSSTDTFHDGIQSTLISNIPFRNTLGYRSPESITSTSLSSSETSNLELLGALFISNTSPKTDKEQFKLLHKEQLLHPQENLQEEIAKDSEMYLPEEYSQQEKVLNVTSLEPDNSKQDRPHEKKILETATRHKIRKQECPKQQFSQLEHTVQKSPQQGSPQTEIPTQELPENSQEYVQQAEKQEYTHQVYRQQNEQPWFLTPDRDIESQQQRRLDDDGSMDSRTDFKSRNKFIIDVMYLVMLLWLCTAMFIYVVIKTPEVNLFFRKYAIFIFVGSILGLFGINYSFLYCSCTRNLHCSLFMCLLALVGMSCLAAVATARFETEIVLYSVMCVTCLALLGIFLAFIKFDFTTWYLYVVTIPAALAVSILAIFIGMKITGYYLKPAYFGILLVSVVVQALLLIIEIKIIIGGKVIQLGDDDWVHGGFMVYTSIVDLFVKCLQMFCLKRIHKK